MELGTGVFLGATSLSLAWLYVATKDRWKWKRVLLGLALLVAVLGGSLWGYLLWESYQTEKQSRQRQFELWDLRIGASKDDVLFLKGEPKEKQSGDSLWIYQDAEITRILRFENEEKLGVIMVAGTGYRMPSVGPLYSSDEYAEIVRKLGEPSRISISKDRISRLLSFDAQRIVVEVKAGNVVGIGIYADRELRYRDEANQGQAAPAGENSPNP